MKVPNKNIRKTIIEMVNTSGAAHSGSALSLVEILNTVFKNVDLEKIKNNDIGRDRVILSKGHGTAALYAVMYHNGLLDKSLIDTYFKNNTILAGHTSHHVPCVEHSTGGLGHGFSVSLGVAIGMRTKKINSRVYVILGDGEMQEGSNWEAMMLAGHLKICNLIALIDINELGQVGKLEDCCTLKPLAQKFESFNFNVYDVDGHDEEQINSVISKSKNSPKPTVILCHTIKGRGISYMEKNNLWHYKCPKDEFYEKAIEDLNDQN
jgi:transketolase